MRTSRFSSLVLAIGVCFLCPQENVLKVLRLLGKSRTSQKSSLISEEKVNKILSYSEWASAAVILDSSEELRFSSVIF